MAKELTKKIGFAAIIASLSIISLTGCKKTTSVDNPNGGKDSTIVTPPVQELSVEKQWLLNEEVDLNLAGQVFKAKGLIDISVTNKNEIIAALQQSELAALFNVPADSFWYQESSAITKIEKKDNTSGTISFMQTDNNGNKSEMNMKYLELTENSVKFENEEGTLTAKASPEKITPIKIKVGN